MYTYVNFQPEILNSELVNSWTSLTLFITYNVSGSARVAIIPVIVPVLANLDGQVLLTIGHRAPRFGSNQQSPFVQVTIQESLVRKQNQATLSQTPIDLTTYPGCTRPTLVPVWTRSHAQWFTVRWKFHLFRLNNSISLPSQQSMGGRQQKGAVKG